MSRKTEIASVFYRLVVVGANYQIINLKSWFETDF